MSPVAIGFIIAAVLIAIVLVTGYVKAPPDKAYIISGWREKPKVLVGRAGFRIPFIERLDIVDLKIMTILINKTDPVPTIDCMFVKVDAVATAKVDSTAEQIAIAAQNFLNMSSGDSSKISDKSEFSSKKTNNSIASMIDNILDGSLREVIGQIKIEDLVSKRDEITRLVNESATKDLKKLGIRLDTFNIQKFDDEYIDGDGVKHSMIKELGTERATAILKTAANARAAADADIRIAQAEADKRANDIEVENGLAIAKRNNELNVTKEELRAVEERKKAEADTAYEITNKERQKAINLAEGDAKIAAEQKNAEIQEVKVSIKEREYQADIEKKAKADRIAKQEASEANLYTRKQEAEAKRIEQEQEAAGAKAIADAQKYAGLAEADAIEAKGKAEASALQNKIDAMNRVNENAVTQIKLDTAKEYIGQLPSIMGAFTKPMEKIDKITMFGSGNAAKITESITTMFKQASDGIEQSLGLSLPSIMSGIFGGAAAAKLANAGKQQEIPVPPEFAKVDSTRSRARNDHQ